MRVSTAFWLFLAAFCSGCWTGSTAFTSSSSASWSNPSERSFVAPRPFSRCSPLSFIKPTKIHPHVTQNSRSLLFSCNKPFITRNFVKFHQVILQLWQRYKAWLSKNNGKGLRVLRRKLLAVALALCLVWGGGSDNAALAAVSGGRAGGTFKSSQRPTVSRNFAPRSSSYHRRPIPRVIITSPPSYYGHNHAPMVMTRSTAVSKTDVVVLGSVAGLLTYGMVSGRRGANGYGDATQGATATAIMLAVNVPDRYHPDSIVRRINEITKRTDTKTRGGVQTLISEVCLELVRQQASIQAAWSDSNHYKSANAALKDFQGRSIENRSRYDQETMFKFNAEDYNAETETKQTIADGKATVAVVSVHFVTEGEDISHFMSMRADVVNLLRWTAATVPVSSLLAGEVLWSPQRTTDTLSRRDIDERYPELTPLI